MSRKLIDARPLNLILASAVFVMGASSCINEDYDLSKINNEVTVFPELVVPVNKDIDNINAKALLNLDGTCVRTSEDGNYSLGSSRGEAVSVVLEAAGLRNGMAVSDALRIAFEDVPVFLQSGDCDFTFSHPQLGFTVSNSGSGDILMTARATAYGDALTTKSPTGRTVEFTAVIPAGADNATVLAQCEGLEEFFSPVPEYITVDDMVLRGQCDDDMDVTVSLCGEVDIPLAFESGSSMVVDYVLDTEKYGLDLASYGISTEKFMADCKVKSSFPMDFDVEVLVGGPRTEVGLDRAINGGSIAAPAVTDVKADFFCEGDISDIKTMILRVKATNHTQHEVSLAETMSLSVAVSDLVLSNGITMSLDNLKN